MNRTKIAVAGLLSLLVLSVLNLLLDISGVKLPDISTFDKLVSQARTALPASGTIGYYTDYNDAPNGTNALREYYLMQYALAPVVVEKSTNQKFIITSLHDPQKPVPIRNLVLMRDFGSGVKLLRNTAK